MNEFAFHPDADGRRVTSTDFRPSRARGPAMKDNGRTAGREAMR
jgi:hypothetical protein